MNSHDIIDYGFLANGGCVWNRQNCECDYEVNAAPCRYCAIHRALEQAATLERTLEWLLSKVDHATLEAAYGGYTTIRNLLDKGMRPDVEVGK